MNIARLLYLGMKLLNYTESELWRMTPRKFFLLLDEGKTEKVEKSTEDEYDIDALWDL